MTKVNDKSQAQAIRSQAEDVINRRHVDDPGKLAALSEVEIRKLLHELSVHQIELEIQNEELRQSTERLEKAHQDYFNLYDLAPIGYLTIDQNGKILKGNQFLSKLLDADRNKILSASITDFIFSEDQDLYYHFRRKTFVTHGPQRSCELRMVNAGGNPIWTNLSASCGEMIHGSWETSVVLTDISRLKRAEESLILNSKLASLGLLSMGIAHEINNPLTIIAGTLQLMDAHPADSLHSKEGHKTIEMAVRRMKRIVDGLQKFSRSPGSKVRTDSDLSKAVGEAIYMLKGSLAKESIDLIFDSSTAAPILCDEVEIEQVIFNLIGNSIGAVKHLADKWIRIELLLDVNDVVLRVTDSGPGIPDAIRARMFDPFFTTKEVGQGTGLGLSISKGILDNHGATIEVLTNRPNT